MVVLTMMLQSSCLLMLFGLELVSAQLSEAFKEKNVQLLIDSLQEANNDTGQNEGGLSLHPLVFVGGMGASTLRADVNKTTVPHWYCTNTEKDYKLWLFYENFAPAKAFCWIENMRLAWKDGVLQDTGVEAKLPGDALKPGSDIKGGFAVDLWTDYLKGVEDLGYSPTSPSVIALHYDWRKSVQEWAVDGTFAKMKEQIESQVAKASGQRAVIVSLSLGVPTMHKFFATFVDAAWKEKNIERWVSASGSFGGVVELARMYLYPEPVDLADVPKYFPYLTLPVMRELWNTFSASFMQKPTFLRDDEVLFNVSTAPGKPPSLYYTKDLGAALHDAGLSQAKELLDSHSQAYVFSELPAPGVTVDCLYGDKLASGNSVQFAHGFGQRSTGYSTEDGDGTVPARSLRMCEQWKAADNTSAPPVSLYAFPGSSHQGVLHDKAPVAVFAKIMRTLYPHRPTTGAVFV